MIAICTSPPTLSTSPLQRQMDELTEQAFAELKHDPGV
jgi:hypothetical protein